MENWKDSESPNRAKDAAALLRHLQNHDVPCPDCGYNLRGLSVLRCPECGGDVPLDVAREQPKGLLMPMVVALLLPSLASPLSIVLVVDAILHGGPVTYNHAVQFVVFGTIASPLLLLGAIFGAGPPGRMSIVSQRIAMGMAIAWDAALLLIWVILMAGGLH